MKTRALGFFLIESAVFGRLLRNKTLAVLLKFRGRDQFNLSQIDQTAYFQHDLRHYRFALSDFDLSAFGNIHAKVIGQTLGHVFSTKFETAVSSVCSADVSAMAKTDLSTARRHWVISVGFRRCGMSLKVKIALRTLRKIV